MNQKHLQGYERRTFPRIKYRAYATLITTRENWPAHLIDLSFHGALIAVIYRHNIRDGEEIQLTIEPVEQKPIYLYGHVAHHTRHMLGIECRATGIDAQQRLRKMVRQSPSIDYMNRSLETMLDEHERERERERDGK